MKEIKSIDDKYKVKFYVGTKNTLVRWYFYTQRGLMLLNEFRYLFMGCLAIYFALKMSNPVMLVVMFCVTLPILIFLGWAQVHHISKIVDFLSIEHSTHWSRYNYTLLEDIKKELEKLNAK